MSKLAFKHGREREAWILAQADAVANPEAAKKLAEDCRWADLLKQPSMGARWGIGLNLAFGKEPVDRGQRKQKRKVYEGDPQSFGVKVAVREGMEKRVGTERARVPGNLNEKLFFYAGDFGEKILNGFVERARQGKLGERVKASFDGVVGQYDFNAYSNAGRSGNANQAGMLFKYDYSAPVKTPGAESFVEQGPLMPAVYYVGTNTDPEKSKELIDKAEKEGIDFYLQFDISVNPAKEARSLTEAKVSLYHIPRASDAKSSDSKKAPKGKGDKPERLLGTKILKNKTVEEAREAGKDDPVDAEVRAFFEEIEKRFELKDPPEAITAERAQTRCENLAGIGADAVNPLRLMMEIRYWHAKGLIDDAKLEELYAKFVGTDDAKQLLTGEDASKRIEVIAKFLPIPTSQDLASYAKILAGTPATGSSFPGGFPSPAGATAPPPGVAGGPGPGYGAAPLGSANGSTPPGAAGGPGPGYGAAPLGTANGSSPPGAPGSPLGTSGGSSGPPGSSGGAPLGSSGGSSGPPGSSGGAPLGSSGGSSGPPGSSGGAPLGTSGGSSGPPGASPTPGSGPPS